MVKPLAALGRFVYVCFDQKFPPGPEKPFPSGSFAEADMCKQPKKHVVRDDKVAEPILCTNTG